MLNLKCAYSSGFAVESLADFGGFLTFSWNKADYSWTQLRVIAEAVDEIMGWVELNFKCAVLNLSWAR